MRRIPALVVSLTAISALGAALLVAPPTQAAPAKKDPRASLKGTVVQPELFGMHVFNLQNVWPTVPVGSIRLWDTGTTWSSVEKSQDNFDWKDLDAAVANTRANGVDDILMVLAGTPAWASDDPTSGGVAGVLPGAAGMPKRLSDWEDWVRQVVTRYKGRITSYQPWNEANLVTFSTGTAEEMADLTKIAYDVIKEVDPAASVVAASTGTRLGGPFKRFYPAYLRELKARNWPIDVWSAHTYPASLGTPVERAALVEAYKSVLRAAGAPDLPIWDTENNFGLAGPGPTNPDQDIEGKRAAEWTARTYLESLRLGISRVYWYAWGPYNDLVGIQMNTGSKGAEAYATLQDWIVGATFVRCDGVAKVKCTFTKDGVRSKIVWAERGTKVFPTRGFTQVCYLDGSCKPITKKKLRISGPVQFRR